VKTTSFNMEAIGIVKMTGNQYIREVAADNGVFLISVMCNFEIYNITFKVPIYINLNTN